MIKTNAELVQELIREGHLKTPIVIEAFRAVDRRDFVPKKLEKEAYANEPLPIGYDQTISQPLTVAFMLEFLDPKPHERILDIGAGSGWQAALLAYIVSAKEEAPRGMGGALRAPSKLRLTALGEGEVIAVERIPELRDMAETNVRKYNFIEKGIARVLLGDGSQGVPREFVRGEGFDKIVAAASAREIPLAWKKQLKVGGRIVAPVGTSICVIEKHAQDRYHAEEYAGFVFVPLVAGLPRGASHAAGSGAAQ